MLKFHRELKERLSALGYHVTLHALGSHYRMDWRRGDYAGRCVLAVSPSDHRAMHNVLAQIKRQERQQAQARGPVSRARVVS